MDYEAQIQTLITEYQRFSTQKSLLKRQLKEIGEQLIRIDGQAALLRDLAAKQKEVADATPPATPDAPKEGHIN